MEPRKENANDREAFMRTFSSREGFPAPAIQYWSEENHCYIVNGVEAAIPLSGPTPLGATDNEASLTDMSRSKKKKITEREEEFFFKLFKFPKAGERYLLEIHEIKTGGIDRCQVSVDERNGIGKVVVRDLMPGDHVVVKVLQDPKIPIFNKTYDIPLEERLRKWSKECRQRHTGKHTGKRDKFYFHWEKQFRSLVEVITFILYSCKGKDLNIANKTTQEDIEFEDVESMVTISSSNVTETSFKK